MIECQWRISGWWRRPRVDCDTAGSERRKWPNRRKIWDEKLMTFLICLSWSNMRCRLGSWCCLFFFVDLWFFSFICGRRRWVIEKYGRMHRLGIMKHHPSSMRMVTFSVIETVPLWERWEQRDIGVFLLLLLRVVLFAGRHLINFLNHHNRRGAGLLWEHKKSEFQSICQFAQLLSALTASPDPP